MIKLFSLCLMVILFTVFPSAIADETGDGIAYKVYNRDDGQTMYSEGRMLLIDKNGNRIERRLRMYGKEYNGLNRTLIVFDSPVDIKGTAFLSWENKDKDDDQFIYLPALGRVRRIVSSNKGNSFVGSDIIYEDLTRRKPWEYNNEIFSEYIWDGKEYWVLRQTPKEGIKSVYGYADHWVDPETFLVVKAKLYDKKGDLIKVINAPDVQKIDGIATIMRLEVEDVKEHHKTIMITDKIQYNIDIDDRTFTKQSLSQI